MIRVIVVNLKQFYSKVASGSQQLLESSEWFTFSYDNLSTCGTKIVRLLYYHLYPSRDYEVEAILFLFQRRHPIHRTWSTFPW